MGEMKDVEIQNAFSVSPELSYPDPLNGQRSPMFRPADSRLTSFFGDCNILNRQLIPALGLLHSLFGYIEGESVFSRSKNYSPAGEQK